MTLNPGAYTFVAKGNSGQSGIVLVEVYDADKETRMDELLRLAVVSGRLTFILP